jgi:hypothetical protein
LARSGWIHSAGPAGSFAGDDRGAGGAPADAHAAGELIAATSTADIVDALLVLLALPAISSLPSDPNDVKALVAERRIPLTVVAV